MTKDSTQTRADRWRTLRFEELPGPPDAPWRGLEATVTLRFAEGRELDPDAVEELLPLALALVVEDLVRRGHRPPFFVEFAARVTVLGGIEVGRLAVGSGPEVEWTGGSVDLPVLETAERPGTGAEPPDASGGRAPDSTPVAPPDPPRVLQCRVGPDDPDIAPDNVLRAGRNTVGVFLGPEEAGALAGGVVTDEDLAFAGADWVVVKVQLTPLEPEVGVPSSGDLLVPRNGQRTATLPLIWEIPADATRARAQLAVTRDGRVIAVSELVGKIGDQAKLVGRMSLGRPDADHAGVDQAVLLSSDASGTPALVVPSETRVELLPDLEQLAENVRDALNQVVHVSATNSAAAREAARKVLVAAAQAGRDLYLELEPLLGDLTAATVVQVVTALAPHALPVELFYLLPAPADDAPVCPTWLAGGQCGPDCGGEDGSSTVCPGAFWGVGRVVERHYRPERQGEAVLQVPTPDAARPRLSLGALAFAASDKVTDPTLQKADFDPAQRVRTWQDWRTAVAAGAGMLVLMPHTLPKPPSLEVSGQTLHRARLTRPFVTSGLTGAPPAVVLFGCDTGGQQADPIGYTTRFLGLGAGVVFASFSLLRAGTAAALASRLIAALRDPARAGQPVGSLLAEVRAGALHDGELAALAITAFGDADWRV